MGKKNPREKMDLVFRGPPCSFGTMMQRYASWAFSELIGEEEEKKEDEEEISESLSEMENI